MKSFAETVSLCMAGILCTLVCAQFISAQQMVDPYPQYLLKQAWITKGDFEDPEAVVISQKHQAIFVSNANGYGQNEEGFISKLSIFGDIEELKWLEGINSPSGMAIDDDTLWIIDFDRLLEVSIPHQYIKQVYYTRDEDPRLKDVIVSDGEVYVTGAGTNTIYEAGYTELDAWMRDDIHFKNIRGISATSNTFYVAAETLVEVQRWTKKATTFRDNNSIRNYRSLRAGGPFGGFIVSLAGDYPVYNIAEDGSLLELIRGEPFVRSFHASGNLLVAPIGEKIIGGYELPNRWPPLETAEVPAQEQSSDVQISKSNAAPTTMPRPKGEDVTLAHEICSSRASVDCINRVTAQLGGNIVNALQLFFVACEQKDWFGCNNVGIALSQKGTQLQDYKVAYSLFLKSCANGNGEGCFLLGQAYYLGNGVPKNLFRAKFSLETSCEAGYSKGCRGLADLYRAGEGVPANPEVAFDLYSKACRGGDQHACNSGIVLKNSHREIEKRPPTTDFASISRSFYVGQLNEDVDYQKELSLRLTSADTKDPSLQQELLSKRNDLPPPFLYDLAEYTFDTDPKAAVGWYSLGRIRARLDAALCTDTTARQGIAYLAGRAPRVAAYIRANPKEAGAIGLEVLAGDEVLKSRASPWWICSHGVRAISNALRDAMGAEARQQIGLEEPTKEKSWLIPEETMAEIYPKVLEGSRRGFERLIDEDG